MRIKCISCDIVYTMSSNKKVDEIVVLLLVWVSIAESYMVTRRMSVKTDVPVVCGFIDNLKLVDDVFCAMSTRFYSPEADRS